MTSLGRSIRITHCYRRLWRTADLAADRQDPARIVQAMIDRGFISSVAAGLEAAAAKAATIASS